MVAGNMGAGNRGKQLLDIEAKNKILRKAYELQLTREVFNKFDEDGSGAINAEEFRLLCKALGYEFATKEDVENAMRIVDDDKSGEIEWDEFAAWWQSEDKFAEFAHLLDDDAFFFDDKSKPGVIVEARNDEDDPDWPVFMLHPHALFRTIWDLLSAVAIVYSALFVPYRMAFTLEPEGGALVFDRLVDLSFICDMILSFFTAYEDKEAEEIVAQPGRVANNYFRSWFFPDFLASFPFDSVAKLTMDEGEINPDQLRTLKLIRLLRLLKIMRMVKMSRLLVKAQEKFTIKSGIMISIKFLLLCGACAHYLACGWYVMSTLDPEPWVVCKVGGITDHSPNRSAPTALSLGDCPDLPVVSYVDANGTQRIEVSERFVEYHQEVSYQRVASKYASNHYGVEHFVITANHTGHDWQIRKPFTNWVYRYFIGICGGAEWEYHCDSSDGHVWISSNCADTNGDAVFASGRVDCETDRAGFDTGNVWGDVNSKADDVESCLDINCLKNSDPNCTRTGGVVNDPGIHFKQYPIETTSGPRYPLGHVPKIKIYVAAFYWSITTMTTLGYGEINASSPKEQIFVMLSIGIGCVIFAYGITNMCTLVANLNSQEVFAQTRSDEIIEWMSNNNVPEIYKKKMMQYFTYKISYSPVYYHEGGQLLFELSPELRKAVLVSHYDPIMTSSPLFALDGRYDKNGIELALEASETARAEMAPVFMPVRPRNMPVMEALIAPMIECLNCEVFFAGEFLVQPDLYVRGLFFIVHGNANLDPASGVTAETLGKGSSYGEYALKGKVRANETLTANVYLDTFVLLRDDFLRICKSKRIDVDGEDCEIDWKACPMGPPKEDEEPEEAIDLGLTDTQLRLRQLQTDDLEQEEMIGNLLNSLDKRDKFGPSTIADGI